jgi:hypothetical protein
MNADMNPRGGLTVDRDSLHASPGYARQVEAAKQLQERSVNADVEKAVERMLTPLPESWLKGATAEADARDMALIAQHLRDQEAEIAGLRADLSDADERAAMRNRERTEAVMRAEKAEALLRECRDEFKVMPKSLAYGLTIVSRITAHLGGEHE